MTADDQQRFARAFNTLAVATRLPADEGDAAMKMIYFRGLEEFAIEAVEQAAGELAIRAQWFPKLAEWRAQAKPIHVAVRVKALPPPREEPWRDECEVCRDTGWEIRRCYPGSPVTCGRKVCRRDGREHTYAVRCACWGTNRTLERHRLAMYGRLREQVEA